MSKYIHIRNLEKYHPAYRDRELKWAKIYFQMVQGDPDCELIDNEIDWARLIKFILLELQAKKPIPLDEEYLKKKGFDLRKRPISLTLNMLQKFVVECDVDKDKEEYKEDKKEDSVPDTLMFDTQILDMVIAYRKEKKLKSISEPEKVWVLYFLNYLPVDFHNQKMLEAWCDWIDYRKEKKKPLTNSTIKQQIKFLMNQPEPAKCIYQSIARGWLGLFEFNRGNNGNGTTKAGRGAVNPEQLLRVLNED